VDQVLLRETELCIENSNEIEELRSSLSKLKDAFIKKSKWLDKLALLSDHQQEKLRKQNQQALFEQTLASKKQKKLIINELDGDNRFDINIAYIPADILSGDTYSIHKTSDGGILVYLADIMGHGLLASLTTFPLSIYIKQRVGRLHSLESLMDKLSYLFETMLIDDEMMAGSFFWFNNNFTELSYAMGGMYPALLQDGEDTIELKSNNSPAMGFMPHWKIKNIKLNNFRKLAIYSDGLVEGDFMPIAKANHLISLQKETIDELNIKGQKSSPEDDLTVILFEKITQQ
jgi:serine phosphatase RsbU (regulator of sigma subunit)